MSPRKQRRGLIAWLILLAMSCPLALAQTSDSGSGVIKFGAARLDYDPSKWTVENEKAGKWNLDHKNGDAYAVFIAERIPASESAIADFVLQEARKGFSQAKLLSQENRTIAGEPVRVIRFSGEYRGSSMTGQGCFYGGKLGAVQVIAWTGTQLFDEYQSDFDQLCEGLVMGQNQSAGAIRSVGPENKSATAKDQAPAAPPPPAVFILKNGERIESSRYTLTADSVRVQQGDKERTIPVSALNLEATNAANHARGLDVKVPTSNNQMILSF